MLLAPCYLDYLSLNGPPQIRHMKVNRKYTRLLGFA